VEKKCFITQTVIGTKDQRKQKLLGITVGNFGPEKKLGIVIQAPLGFRIFLSTGFKLNVPGTEATQIGVQFCLPRGCSATKPLSPELIAAMKKANAGSLELQTIRKQVIQIPVSFKGFTAAITSLNNP